MLQVLEKLGFACQASFFGSRLDSPEEMLFEELLANHKTPYEVKTARIGSYDVRMAFTFLGVKGTVPFSSNEIWDSPRYVTFVNPQALPNLSRAENTPEASTRGPLPLVFPTALHLEVVFPGAERLEQHGKGLNVQQSAILQWLQCQPARRGTISGSRTGPHRLLRGETKSRIVDR
jgi:hypothetical protein